MDPVELEQRARRVAWRGDELAAEPTRWQRTLPPALHDAVSAAAAMWREAHGDDVLGEAWAQPVTLPHELVRTLQDWAREVLRDGPGLLLVRGLPHDPADPSMGAVVVGLLGQAMGTLRSQQRTGHRVTEVKDFKRPWADAATRAYRTGDPLPFHVDGAEIVALRCQRSAPRGGRSRMVSSHHVVAEVARRRPDLVRWLTTPLPHDRHDEQAPGESPVFHETLLDEVDGRLELFIVDWYIRRAVRHPGVEVDDAVFELLDLIEAIAREPGVSLDLTMQPGDIQLLHNRRVLHAREAFVDGETPDTQRLMHRVWIERPGLVSA